MSSGSILGLQEELKLPNKIEPVKHPRVHMPPFIPTKKKENATVPSSFFRGTSVFIHIQDETIEKVMKEVLPKIGATILQDYSLMVDCVISDKQINLLPPTNQKSRGSALLKSANIEPKTPRLVLINQIPWIYSMVSKDLQNELALLIPPSILIL